MHRASAAAALQSLLILLLLTATEAKKTVCVKQQHNFQTVNFYQRIEIPSPIDCAERCVENADACKAAVYLEYSNHKTFCQFYNTNSLTDKWDIWPTKRTEPALTLFEIMDSCASEIAYASRTFVKELSPSIKRLLDSLPKDARNKNDYRQVQNELTLTVSDQRVSKKSPLFARSEHFAERDDASNHQTYLLKPKYPFDGQKQPIRPASAGRAGVLAESSDYTNDLNANGGDAGAPVATRRPVASVSGHSSGVSANPLQSSPITPVLVSHGGIPSNQDSPNGGVYIANNVKPSGYSTYNAVYKTGSASRLGQSFNCPPNPCGAPTPVFCPTIPPSLDPCQTPVSMAVNKAPAYWSEWHPSSPCSVTCGTGLRQRKRFCSSGNKPDCPGEPIKEEPCVLPECNTWSEWSIWTKCSASCGGGQQTRTRVCRNGNECEGPMNENQKCAEVQCPKPPPSWGPWEQWSDCSKTCGTGERVRRRECVNGLGDDCVGAHLDHMFCNPQACPAWQEWQTWTQCSATCGDGASRLRIRECKYQGFPSDECPGTAQDQAPCQLGPCPSWASWSSWSPCSTTCGHGQQKRTRECEPRGAGCIGGNQEIRFCQQAVCPYFGLWSEWTTCSASCGRGTMRRSRKCIKNEQLPGAVLPSEEELMSGNIEAFKPEPEQQDDTDGPTIEVETNKESESKNKNESGETKPKTKPASNKKPKDSSSQSSVFNLSAEASDAIKAQIIERSQTLKNTTNKGRAGQLFQLREQTLEVTQSSSIHLSDRRRAPSRTYLLSLQDSPPFGSTNVGCLGPETETQDCQIQPCCEWSSWSSWTYCADPCNTNGGQKIRSRTCQVQLTYAMPAPSPLVPFIQPRFDYVPSSAEYNDGVRVKRQYRPNYTSYSAVSQFGQASSIPQPGQPFGMPQTNPAHTMPGTPFSKQQAVCECPGKSMELKKCGGEVSACSQGEPSSVGVEEYTVSKKNGEQRPDNDEAGAALRANEGESGKGKNRNYDKQVVGIGTSVELTNPADTDNVEVETSASQECEFDEWGAWNTCRGSCKKGSRSRTRTCKKRGKSESQNTFDKFIRNDESQCECSGKTVQTESCKPKNCDDNNERDTPPVTDRGIINDEANCYFSEWGDWSNCGKDKVKRRTRLCVGLRALLENCNCEGPTSEERLCPEKTSSKKPSSAVLAISRDILRNRLDQTDSDLEDTRLVSRQFDLPTTGKDETSEKFLSETRICHHLEWQEWSSCEGVCGETGKRMRARLCPCRNCGIEAGQMIETCLTEPCVPKTNNNKYPFD